MRDRARRPARLIAARALALALLLLVCGCAGELAFGGRAAGADPTGPPPPRDAVAARVTGVTDGDTLGLSGLGRSRVIGVDTPEVHGRVECYGREASAFARRTLAVGARVRYTLGLESRDRYGRALVYVWLSDGRFFNGLLLLEGYAVPLTIPPNVEHADLFLRLSRRARATQRGLWAPRACGGRP